MFCYKKTKVSYPFSLYIYIYIYVCVCVCDNGDDDEDCYILTHDSGLYHQNYNLNIFIDN